VKEKRQLMPNRVEAYSFSGTERLVWGTILLFGDASSPVLLKGE
jgi:hypothetical protein